MLDLCSITPAEAGDLDRFAEQALAADWACYTAPADRAEADRLRAVIAAFPRGFRLYLSGGEPVGYTGWYPLPRDVFDRLHDAPQSLTHRGQVMALPGLPPGGGYLYLFNYSIVPALRKTAHSRALVQAYAREINATPHLGLAAVTVSPDGVRVAEKFGMSYRGDMTHDGVTEGVYALRL
jgi:hypothetical protein